MLALKFFRTVKMQVIPSLGRYSVKNRIFIAVCA